MAFGITEADAGSNAHNITTTATRDGDEWVLNGQKIFISGVDEAQSVLIVARTQDAKTGKLKPALFVVPTDAPGFTKQPIPMSWSAPEKQFTLFLDDVRLPVDALVGDEDGGLWQLFAGLNPERIMGAALSCGMARFAIEKTVEYAKTRTVWKDQPIGAHQGIQHPIAKVKIELEQARLLWQKAAALYDAGDDFGPASTPTWPSTPAARSPATPPTSPSTPTVATASPSSTASATCWSRPGSAGSPP